MCLTTESSLELDASAGQAAVPERNPCLATSEVLAPAMWSNRQNETK